MAKVLKLAKRLRAEGVPTEVDQFHESPPEGWPRWTLDQVEQSQYVLVICTQTYNLRFRGKEAPGTGRGVKWEGAVITQELYDAETLNATFVPVLLKSADAQHIPILLKGVTHYDLSQKDGFTNLLRRLTAQPKVVAPPVAPTVRRLPNDAEELEALRLDKEIATDTAYYTAKLGGWPAASFGGEEVVQPLLDTIEKVESNPEYREKHRNIWATLYRMLGGAHLIHTKLEMGDKLRAALPYLRQSQEIWPDQQAFAGNISFLETFLRNQGGDTREYLTCVLQILRSPADGSIPGLVDNLTAAANGPERQAQSWLLHQATPNPIWNFLEALQLMIKKERNIDTEIQTTTKLLPDGHVEVQATIGPNVLLWEVDLDGRKFESKNELTQGFMGLIENAKG